MSCEEHRVTAGPRRGKHPGHPLRRLGTTVRQLAYHAGLHVVDDDGHRRRIAGILERLGDGQAEAPAHHHLRPCRSMPASSSLTAWPLPQASGDHSRRFTAPDTPYAQPGRATPTSLSAPDESRACMPASGTDEPCQQRDSTGALQRPPRRRRRLRAESPRVHATPRIKPTRTRQARICRSAGPTGAGRRPLAMGADPGILRAPRPGLPGAR
jgi:hypothetical protein